jgi:hypothetical protein
MMDRDKLQDSYYELHAPNIRALLKHPEKYSLVLLTNTDIDSSQAQNYQGLLSMFKDKLEYDGELVIVVGRKIYKPILLTKTEGKDLVYDRIQGKWKDSMLSVDPDKLGYFRLIK